MLNLNVVHWGRTISHSFSFSLTCNYFSRNMVFCAICETALLYFHLVSVFRPRSARVLTLCYFYLPFIVFVFIMTFFCNCEVWSSRQWLAIKLKDAWCTLIYISVLVEWYAYNKPMSQWCWRDVKHLATWLKRFNWWLVTNRSPMYLLIGHK